jgi:hypothetical protein
LQVGPVARYPDTITTELIVVSCNVAIDCYAGGCWCGVLTAKGCDPPSGNGAINAETGSQFVASHNSLISINSQSGINCVQSTVIYEYSTISQNGDVGMYTQGGTAFCDYSTVTANYYDAIAQGGGYIELVGAAYSSVSPPINTLGGDAAYVHA